MKLLFFRFILWATQYEHAIAVATGRNSAEVSQLRQDVFKWQGYVLRLEMNNG